MSLLTRFIFGLLCTLCWYLNVFKQGAFDLTSIDIHNRVFFIQCGRIGLHRNVTPKLNCMSSSMYTHVLKMIFLCCFFKYNHTPSRKKMMTGVQMVTATQVQSIAGLTVIIHNWSLHTSNIDAYVHLTPLTSLHVMKSPRLSLYLFVVYWEWPNAGNKNDTTNSVSKQIIKKKLQHGKVGLKLNCISSSRYTHVLRIIFSFWT